MRPPDPHGDHFHLGDAVVATRDASGLRNPAVWVALERKGLIRSMYPHGAVVTPLGLDYADRAARDNTSQKRSLKFRYQQRLQATPTGSYPLSRRAASTRREIGRSLSRCAEFFGMDAAGDQQAVNPRSGRAGNVGA